MSPKCSNLVKTAWVAGQKLLTGRFDPNRELRRHPSRDAALLRQQLAVAKEEGDPGRNRNPWQELNQQLRDERDSELGQPEQWQQYRERFDELLRTAVADGVFADRREVRTVFRQMQAHGRMYLDHRAQPWLEVTTNSGLRRVGLSAQNILDPGSDHELALQVLLARTNALLAVNAKHRELWPDFQDDLILLQTAEEATRIPENGIAETKASRR